MTHRKHAGQQLETGFCTQQATRRFFTRALEHGSRPSEVSTDRAPAYPRVLDELLPSACHVVEQYGNNPIESDHGRLKSHCGQCVASNGSARPA
jgi:transposase-like protein